MVRFGIISIPVSARKPVFARIPRDITIASAFIALRLVCTFSTLSVPTMASSLVLVNAIIPSSARWSSTYSVISGSNPGIICSAISMTDTFTPFSFRFSATSSPIKPPPATTARLMLPPSTAAFKASASSGVRIKNTFSRSIPSIGGFTGDAPVEITSLSYVYTFTSPVSTFTPVTHFLSLSKPVTSIPVRTSVPVSFAKLSGVFAISKSLSWMTFPT